MKWLLALALLASPAAGSAQHIVIVDRGTGRAASLLDSVTSRPYATLTGSGNLVLPRDSTVTTSIVVVGRPTYLASVVHGDVVVIGGDLYLRPGAEISGRAISIGGLVMQTSLGHVAGGTESLRDDSIRVDRSSTTGDVALSMQSERADDELAVPMFQLAGIYGLKMPGYDRVDGLSLPVGVELALGPVFVAPTATYRSRLGKIDPSLAIRVGADTGTRFEAVAARDTRTNERWISYVVLNSLKSIAFGTDTRNYFRSDIAQARMIAHLGGERASVEPYVGGRFENVSPILSTGDVFTFMERSDSLKIRRPNPLVDPGHIASALIGIAYASLPATAPVTSRLSLGVERSLSTPAGTHGFTQFTADGAVSFLTFGLQHLEVRGHAVATQGDSVPRARYAYLGGSGTLGLADLLQYGGTDLVFVESRYFIPVPSIVLPFAGSPVFELIHRIGSAGIGSVGPLQQEVGAGIILGPLSLEAVFSASGQHRTDVGVSVTIPGF